MRPDRRFGVGRAPLAAWLMLAALASTALGQGWTVEPVDPKGHAGDVNAVAASGRTLATAGSDGLAKVWDLVDAPKAKIGLVHRLDLVGHLGKVLAVAVSPDSKLVASGGADGTVRLWDAAQGTALATLKGHSGAVEALAFAPDGKTVASGGLDTSIKVWDVDAKQLARTILGHEQGIRGLAFAPDGKLLASASRDHSVKLWNVADGTERQTLGRHDAPAWSLAFAPDGETVASGGLDKTIRLWKVADSPAQPAPHSPGPDEVRAQVPNLLLPPTAVAPSPPPPAAGGSVPAPDAVAPTPTGAAGDSMIVVARPVQVGDGQNPPQSNQVASWMIGEAEPVAVAFTPDGHQVAAAVADLDGSRTIPGSVVFFALPPRQPTQPDQPIPVQTPRATIRGHLGSIFAPGLPPERGLGRDRRRRRLGSGLELEPGSTPGRVDRPVSARGDRGTGHVPPRPGRGAGDHARRQAGGDGERVGRRDPLGREHPDHRRPAPASR